MLGKGTVTQQIRDRHQQKPWWTQYYCKVIK